MLGWEITYSTPTINDQHIEQPNVHHGNTQPSHTTFEDLQEDYVITTASARISSTLFAAVFVLHGVNG